MKPSGCRNAQFQTLQFREREQSVRRRRSRKSTADGPRGWRSLRLGMVRPPRIKWNLQISRRKIVASTNSAMSPAASGAWPAAPADFASVAEPAATEEPRARPAKVGG
eukprot:10229141-Alexandrium_andersonii.AAC.1